MIGNWGPFMFLSLAMVFQASVGSPDSFFHADVGNIITWVLVILGWYTAYVKQNQKTDDRFQSIQRWIELHEHESGERDNLLQQISKVTTQTEKAIESLGKLSDLAERRLQRIENTYFVPRSRKDDPET
jgi:hypothetical protein